MEDKHTPGPWVFAPYSKKRYGLGQPMSKGSGAFFLIQCVHDDTADAINIADARLIAAAPELLDALERLFAETVDYIRINNLGDPLHNQSMKMAEAAIKKAYN